jgi:hypothetical protein
MTSIGELEELVEAAKKKFFEEEVENPETRKKMLALMNQLWRARNPVPSSTASSSSIETKQQTVIGKLGRFGPASEIKEAMRHTTDFDRVVKEYMTKYPSVDACDYNRTWTIYPEETVSAAHNKRNVIFVSQAGKTDRDFIGKWAKCPLLAFKYEEIMLTILAAEAGVGPRLEDAWECRTWQTQPAGDPFYDFERKQLESERKEREALWPGLAARKEITDEQQTIHVVLLERIRGQSLWTWIMDLPASAKGMDMLVEVLWQCQTTLNKLHAAGIYHGDLHLENLLVVPQADGTNVVKLIDFGRSKYMGPKPLPNEWRKADWEKLFGEIRS